MSDNVNPVEDPQNLELSSTPVENSGGTEPSAAPEEQPLTTESIPSPAEQPPTEARRFSREYRIGLWISLLLNGVAACPYLFLTGIAVLSQSKLQAWLYGFIWLVANLLILAVFQFWKPKVFEGLIAGLTRAFIIVFVIGAILTMVCYMAG